MRILSSWRQADASLSVGLLHRALSFDSCLRRHFPRVRCGVQRTLSDHLPLYRQNQIYGREGVDLDVLAFLTTRPNEIVRPVHPDRMPVILAPEDYETWLTGNADAAFALAKPFPAEKMRVVKAGAEKEDAA